MRLVAIIVILIFVLFGVVFGALNAERITLDLYFAQPSVPKGALILAAIAFGWLLGGLFAWLARMPRLRRAERRAREAESRRAIESTPSTDA